MKDGSYDLWIGVPSAAAHVGCGANESAGHIDARVGETHGVAGDLSSGHARV